MAARLEGEIMQFAEYSEIKITGIDGIQKILDMTIREKVNEHGKAKLRLIMNPGVVTETFCIESGGKEIQIEAGGEGIFCGYLTELQDKVCNGVHTLEVEVTSYSLKLDLVKKSRFFQDVGMSYAEVAEHVLSDYTGAVTVWENSGECGIGYPVFQYGETDWEFIKRIASVSNQGIIPYIYASKPYLCIDIQTSGTKQLENYRYLEYGILEDAYHKGKDLCPGEQREYEYHKVLCDKDYSLGSLVSITEGVFRIIEKETSIVDSELHFYYILAGKSAFLQKTIVNKKLCGLQLRGSVTKTMQDKVKVSLDIDKNRTGTGEYFFDWHPISSSIMYAMPEEGEQVNLCIDDAMGQNAAVINCIRSNGSTCADTSQCQNNLFQYQSQKMKLFPDKLSFTMNEGLDSCVMLEMLDTEGIMGQVMSQVKVTAKEAILLKSKMGKVNINTPCQIELKDISENGATLSINQTIECFGQDVQIQAYERISYAPFEDAPVAVKRDWKKLAKKVLAAVVVVAVVAAVAAAIAAVAVLTGGAAVAAIGTAAITVVKTAAIGGAVVAGIGISVQVVNDVMSGTKREFLDYVYMAVDQFCTGAIITAPMGVEGLALPMQMLLVGETSFGYQLIDGELDKAFGGDFYDEDSNMVFTAVMDALLAGVGSKVTKGLNDLFKKLTGRLLRISKEDTKALSKFWNKIPGVTKISSNPADVNINKHIIKNELRLFSGYLSDSKLIKYLLLGGEDAIEGVQPAKPGADIPTSLATDTSVNPILNWFTGSINDLLLGDEYDDSYSEYSRIVYDEKEITVIDFDDNGNLIFE